VAQVNLYPAAIEELLNSPDGPVGMVIAELSDKATVIAKAIVPVMTRKKWNPMYQYGPPGETKASIRSSFARFNAAGQIYGGVNVNFGPTMYLEYPASQYKGDTQYAFMTHTLDLVAL
jgi:hypothetical protein